jgi:MSHA biogenesis protein MshP
MNPPSRRRGFALVTAIFLIVMLAALAAAIAYFSSIQQAGSELDLLGARAYHAAKTGIEWGSFRSLRNDSCPGAGAPTNLAMPAGSLATFTVTVTCVRGTFIEGASSVKIDRITANACNQPAGVQCPNAAPTIPDYVERSLSATVGPPW